MPAALPDVAKDVSAFLAAAGLSLTEGSNLFASDEVVTSQKPDGTTTAVYVRASGGPAPKPYFDAANQGSFHQLGVQVLVRGTRDDRRAGGDLARSIATKLQCASLSGYVATLLRDAQPVFIGLDQNDAPGWAVNVECHFKS